jgi:hypothetical protein
MATAVNLLITMMLICTIPAVLARDQQHNMYGQDEFKVNSRCPLTAMNTSDVYSTSTQKTSSAIRCADKCLPDNMCAAFDVCATDVGTHVCRLRNIASMTSLCPGALNNGTTSSCKFYKPVCILGILCMYFIYCSK